MHPDHIGALILFIILIISIPAIIRDHKNDRNNS